MKVKVREVILYLISSSITGLIYLSLLFLFQTILSINPYISVSIAYISAMVFYFFSNKVTVFKETTNKSTGSQLMAFIPLITFNYLVTLVIVAIVLRFGGNVYVGSILAGFTTMIITYSVFKFLIFKPAVAGKKA